MGPGVVLADPPGADIGEVIVSTTATRTSTRGTPTSGSQHRPVPSDTRSKLKTVLIADDEHLIAAGLVSNVRSLGYEPMGPAGTGEQALEIARETKPDLAMLDIRMPGMGGIEVARILWEEMRTPTVIVSAYSDPESVQESSDAGVFAYLLKPVDPVSLRVTISVAWSRAQALLEHAGRVEQLTRNLNNRRTVEQAKWKLVEEQSMNEQEAHRRLQVFARSTRTSLVEIARQVLEDGLDLTDTET